MFSVLATIIRDYWILMISHDLWALEINENGALWLIRVLNFIMTMTPENKCESRSVPWLDFFGSVLVSLIVCAVVLSSTM